MTEIIPCPENSLLRDLLSGDLSDEQQADLCRHLENCPICQEKLENAAAGKETWTDAARNLNAGQEAPEAGLQRILAETNDAPGPSEAPEVPLDFLSPSADPAHLGKLGQFEVIEVISRGGMSIVLKAFDSLLHRMLAIKVLAPHLAATAAARMRFYREGRAAAAISHDHVAGVLEIGEINGLPFLVREYISGESLQERLDRDGPMELKEILRIGMQTAQGLAAAHAQGLVHRDIKPANIMLHNGVARVKIIDFGLARTLDDATLTQSGVVAGTPQYMSPEQARGDAIDGRTDLFSLGSVLYAMCTGRPPFRASTTMGVLKRVSEESPRVVREVNADVPNWLAEIIGKLHAKNPAERYQSAAEVAELLGRHLAEMQQGASASSATGLPPSMSLPTSRPSGRSPKRPWAIVAALLPVIAGLFVVSEATGVTNMTEFMATVLRIQTSEGTLVVETDDPGIEVAVDGGEIKIHGAGPKEIRVKPGEHRIHATKDGKAVPVEEPLVTVTRGGKTIVRIRQESILGRASAPKTGRPRSGMTGKVLMSAGLRGHEGIVRSLSFTPDGNGLISVGGGSGGLWKEEPSGELRRWDIAAFLHQMHQTGQPDPAQRRPVWSAASPSVVFAAVLSPGGMYMITAEGDGTVRLRDAATGQVESILRGQDQDSRPVLTVALEPHDCTLIASSGVDPTIKIWRNGRNELLETFASGYTALVNCLAFSKDGKTLAVAGADHEKVEGKPVADGDGRRPSKKEHTHSVRLFTVGSWKLRIALTGHKGPVQQLAFSPDGKLLATASDDGTVKLWSVENGKELDTLKSPKSAGKLRCLAFSPDGSKLATGGEQPITLWNVGSRKLLLELDGQDKIFSIAFSPNGRTLAFGCADRTIKLWNIGGQLR